MLVVSVPAFLFVDKWGRRTSAIAGGVTLSGCMFLMGTLYAAGAVHPYGVARWVAIIAVFVFGLTYCATWGIVGKIYASEIQPGHTRAAANCVAQGLNYVGVPGEKELQTPPLQPIVLTLGPSVARQLARRDPHTDST